MGPALPVCGSKGCGFGREGEREKWGGGDIDVIWARGPLQAKEYGRAG